VRTNDGTVDLDLAGALSGNVIQYHAGPSLGFQISPRLRVGASLFAVYEDQREFRKLFADAHNDGHLRDHLFPGLVDAKATRIGTELMAGAQLDAGERWLLGVSVRSPRWVFYERAENRQLHGVDFQGPGARRSPSRRWTTSPSVPRNRFHAPTELHRGAAKGLGPVEASLQLELRPAGLGSSTAQRTVLNAASGVLWQAGANTSLGAGVFSDRSGAGPPGSFRRASTTTASPPAEAAKLGAPAPREPASSLLF